MSIGKKSLLGLVVVGLFAVVCKVVTEEGKTTDVTTLRIEDDEISGWVEDADGYKQFNTVDKLREAINGAADKYFEYGATQGFKQELIKSSSPEMTVRYTVIDCGSAPNATNLYNYMKENITIKANVGTYPEATAIINTDFLSSVFALGHIGKYYTEVTPDGFTKNDMINSATNFIEVLDGKINP